MISYFQYVPHHSVNDFISRGWVIADTFADIHHGAYSILMKWEGHGEPR